MSAAMVRADVGGGAEFRKNIPVAPILAAGIPLNAVTDGGVGADECRLVCSVTCEGSGFVTAYRVEFFEQSLQGALAGSAPSWRAGSPWFSSQNNGPSARLSAANARAIERLFSATEQAEIDAFASELETEIAE